MKEPGINLTTPHLMALQAHAVNFADRLYPLKSDPTDKIGSPVANISEERFELPCAQKGAECGHRGNTYRTPWRHQGLYILLPSKTGRNLRIWDGLAPRSSRLGSTHVHHRNH